ncbi:MAG: phage portal protein [Chloroflexi bacterium]|nr:phage portal protein [Chloroflexota bacterium]
MAALIESLSPVSRQRRAGPINSFDDWVGLWGLESLPSMLQTTMPVQEERNDGSFASLVTGAYLRNSVVFACLAVRARLFSTARFQFQQLRAGRPGNLFGTPELARLEFPEPGKTTSDLLSSLILDADLGGHGIALGRRDATRRLRPDWVTIAYGSKGRSTELGSWDPDAEIIGFTYYPGGPTSGSQPVHFLPEEIAHFTPTKDPLARNRGISLLTAGLREVLADNASTTYKLSFFENAATPNLALKFPPAMNKEKALEWIELFEQEHRGATKAFKTIFLGAGVEAVPVGTNFKELDFATVQGRAETRIAMLTGMHPVVVALSEGLQGSSLNSGNFGQAIRLVAGAALHPLWEDVAGSMQTIMPPPAGTRLWYDVRDVPLLREEAKDRADTINTKATAMRTLADGGWDPDSVVAAVEAEDFGLLRHSGKLSVQLQEPGAAPASAAAPPAAFRVRQDFWSVDDPLRALGTIHAGGTYTGDHPLVMHFPSMFEQVATSERLVTWAQVHQAREQLRAQGTQYGDDAVGALLNVSASTVKRVRQESHARG